MTIYSELIKRGYTDAEIREAGETRPDTRTITLSVYDTPDGWPIVGVQYMCDFRSEEETGIGHLSRAIEGSTNQVEKIKDTPEGGFIFLTDLYTNIAREILEGRSYWAQNLGYAQGAETLSTYRMTVSEMKQWAKDNHLSLKGKTKRDDIEPLVRRKSIDFAEKKTPHKWPANFHNGRVLYTKADGVVGETLKLIFMAAGENAVGVSGTNNNPFGRGFGFFDKRDIGPKLQADIDESNRAYAEAMEALKPVEAELHARGFRFYYLGGPKHVNGATRYWMNGMVSDLTHGKQSSGWYSLEELLSEKFVEDSRRRKLQDELIFSGGNYRKDVIYTEKGQYDYKAMAARDGKPYDIAYEG